MFNLLTTATSVGVAIRYAITIIGAVVTILSIIGWLTPEQVKDLMQKVQDISVQVPALVAAVAGLVTLAAPIYAVLTKSSSDKAAEAAKAIDLKIPPSQDVVIQTPVGVPDIVVAATPQK
jgi:uncharacterized membrane protein